MIYTRSIFKTTLTESSLELAQLISSTFSFFFAFAFAFGLSCSGISHQLAELLKKFVHSLERWSHFVNCLLHILRASIELPALVHEAIEVNRAHLAFCFG